MTQIGTSAGEILARGPLDPHEPMTEAIPTERRASAERASRGEDRRRRPTPRLSRYSFLGGRRRGARRSEEHEGSFVDVYDVRLFAVLAWITLMNVGDSFFTLWHLQAGGIELNPIAQGLLNLGRVEFVLCKSVMISLALLVLCVHKNFYLARWGLFASAATYTALLGWHLYLLTV